MNNLDLKYNKEITCPHCNHKFSDSWEYDNGHLRSFKIDCVDCSEEFNCEIDYDVTYSTSKVEEIK